MSSGKNPLRAACGTSKEDIGSSRDVVTGIKSLRRGDVQEIEGEEERLRGENGDNHVWRMEEQRQHIRQSQTQRWPRAS